jgi:NAD(P)H dehydrogenase (quinone)
MAPRKTLETLADSRHIVLCKQSIVERTNEFNAGARPGTGRRGALRSYLSVEFSFEDPTMTRIAIIYYSSTGNTYQVARTIEAGALESGAEVRLRKVAETIPAEIVSANPACKEHAEATRDVPEAALDDLAWADGFVFGTPTRFGLPAAQLKQFIDTTGPLWAQGKLQDKAAAAFGGAGNVHGGQESTLLALQNVFYHWGSVIVPIGYTDKLQYAAGGNPYGVSFTDGRGKGIPPEILAAGRFQGQRITRFAALLAAGR